MPSLKEKARKEMKEKERKLSVSRVLVTTAVDKGIAHRNVVRHLHRRYLRARVKAMGKVKREQRILLRSRTTSTPTQIPPLALYPCSTTKMTHQQSPLRLGGPHRGRNQREAMSIGGHADPR